MAEGGTHIDIARTHNTARFFTENAHVAWVVLVATLFWGFAGYRSMPKLKDPEIPVTAAAAVVVWPGASAQRVEQLVTRRLEEKVAENASVTRIHSISRNSIAVVIVQLDEQVVETAREFDAIQLLLGDIQDLPSGAGPINFMKDFGNTAALMLTVASPKADALELSIRAGAVRAAIESTRASAPARFRDGRVAYVVSFPASITPTAPERQRDVIVRLMRDAGVARDVRPLDGTGFVGLDAQPDDPAALDEFLRRAYQENLVRAEFHPDVWDPFVVADPATTEAALEAAAGDKYTYRDLDVFTDLIKRSLQTVPQVAKITRTGLLSERIFLEYSQERLGSTNLQASLADILGARNITAPGGLIEIEGKAISIDPSGEFSSEDEIGDVIVGSTSSGAPVYLRDGVEVIRGYESPPRFLNFFYYRDDDGQWQRSRAVTLALHIRSGEQMGDLGAGVDEALATVRQGLPSDLIVAKTSDQPLQVEESVNLFMRSLYEAIVLVVLVALVGFWEWRSALLMALSIPLTLAMTFGVMATLGLDIQGVSIASLIIALGLLVDDPVVAGDAIKSELDSGQPRSVAAWLGPTRLAKAILFSTITNIGAYLPFLLLTGETGRFIYSLPVVLTITLVCSRLVSMSFIPMLGYYLLRPSKRAAPTPEARRSEGFSGAYYQFVAWCVDHRWTTVTASILLLLAGLYGVRNVKSQFFPTDLQYLSFVDLWLPEDATLEATNAAAVQAEEIIRRVADEYGVAYPGEDGQPRDVLVSVTSFVGGGGPRFWFSVAPELMQLNYAQLVIQVSDKHDTARFAAPLQHALSAELPGVLPDVRQLETGKPIGVPVAIRISGDDERQLRAIATEVGDVLRAVPIATRVRNDWGAESFSLKLKVDADRANMSGVSNLDIALSSAAGINGFQVTELREGNRQIPVVVRLRTEERARLSDIRNLYVSSATGAQRVPLGQVSSIDYSIQTEKVRRRNHFRTITVAAYPTPGSLASEVMTAARESLAGIEAALPSGYRMEVGGEEEEQLRGFAELNIVLVVSVVAIFLALVFQFRHAVKPIVVFSAIPFGVVGAIGGLAIMGAPFGFMAFLGMISLIGVIVSNVIVLFDFIEEAHEAGSDFRDALLDAGLVRLRPVMITSASTIFGLMPLALHGGPLWEPLCYVQIAGLVVATFLTLVLVPVIYAIFVQDLKLISWDPPASRA